MQSLPLTSCTLQWTAVKVFIVCRAPAIFFTPRNIALYGVLAVGFGTVAKEQKN